jgi:hypothetical protein
MTSDRKNYWLEKTFGMQKVSYLGRSFVSIKNWHITVHQNKLVVAVQTVVVFNVFDYLIYCFLTVESLFTGTLDFFFCKTKSTLQDGMHSSYVEELVVNDKDLLTGFAFH